jgi:hypothetical protein
MRVIKLSLVCALGLLTMGVLATSSQALTAGWAIKGQSLSELKLTEEKISLAGGPITLSVPSKGLTLKCSTVEGSGKIFENGSDEATAKLSKCEASKTCKVTEPLTLEIKSELIQAGGSFTYDKVQALKEGKPLAGITFTGECPLPEKSEVTGSVAAQASLEGHAKQSLKFSESISNTVNAGLKEEGKAELGLSLGKSPAILSGEVITQLTGAKAGEEFWRLPYTALCKSLPADGAACPKAERIAAGATFKAEGEVSMQFEDAFAPLNMTCTAASSKLTGTTSAALSGFGAPLPASVSKLEFTSCKEGALTCKVSTGGLPYGAWFTVANVDGEGFFGLSATALTVSCAKFCIYKAGTYSMLFGSGMPATIFMAPIGLAAQTGSDMSCSAATWRERSGSGRSNSNSPNPILCT